MSRVWVAAIAISLAVVSSPSCAAPNPNYLIASTPWPTARHDVARTALAGVAGPGTPILNWSLNGGSAFGFIGGEASIGPDGTLYVAGGDATVRKLLAVNPNGTLKWGAITQGGHSGSTVRADGTVYVGGTCLSAIRPDGAILWQNFCYRYSDTNVFSTPLIGADGSVWANRTDTQKLIKVDPATGALLLEVAVPGIMAPALGPDGTIYTGATDGKLYAVDPNGSIKWGFLAGVGLTRIPLVDSSGMIYIANGASIRAVHPDGTQAWIFTGTGGQLGSAPALGADGTIYVHDAHNVYALRSADGSLKWKYTNNGYGFDTGLVVAPVVDSAGTVYIPALYTQVLAINNGALKWSFSIPGVVQNYSTLILDGSGKLYLCDSNANFLSIAAPNPNYFIASTPWPTTRHDVARTALAGVAGPGTPILNWSLNGGSAFGFIGGEASIGPDGTLYVAGGDATSLKLLAVNPNGTLKWGAITQGGHSGSTIRADGTVYVGGNCLSAIGPDGTISWQQYCVAGSANNVFSTPLIGADGLVWANRTDTQKLIKVDPATGALLLEVAVPGIMAPALGPDGTIYTGATDGKLYAVDPSGSIKWGFLTAAGTPGGGIVPRIPLVDSSGMIYIANGASIQAVHPDGTQAWIFTGTGGQLGSAPALGADGTIYVHDAHNVYALRSADGSLKWKYTNNGYGFDTGLVVAPVVDSAGTVYLPALYNQVLAINNGALKWSFPIPGVVQNYSTLILDGSGKLYICDSNANFLSITTGFVAASAETIGGRPEFQVTSTLSNVVVTYVPLSSPDISFALATVVGANLTLVSDVFEISPNTAFSPVANLAFRFSPSSVGDTSTLAIYRFDGTAWSNGGFISNQVVSLGADPQVTANLAHSSYYALFIVSPDTVPPVLSLSPVDGSTVTTASPQIVAAYSDIGRGINPATVHLVLDTSDVSSSATVTASSTVYIPSAALTQGRHTVTALVADLAGNVSTAAASFFIDSLPPVTTLLVNGLPAATTSLILVSTDSIGFSAMDTGVGVAQILWRLDSGSETVFISTFSLQIGTHTLVFHSVDQAGNAEALRAASVTVTPPSVPSISVTVDFDPDTLNLKSNGQFVTARMEVIGRMSAADITPNSIQITAINNVPLATPLAALAKPKAQLGDADNDGIMELQAKFDREALIAVLPVGEQVKITIHGKFSDATVFSAEDFIRTIMPGLAKAGQACTVFHPASGAHVELPNGALSHDADLTVIELLATPPAEEVKRDESAALHQLKPYGRPYDFGPEGTQFTIPVILTLPYNLDSLGNTEPRDLKIAYWNPAASLWEPLDSVVDTKTRTISAKTTHFSLYQVVGQQGSGGASGAPAVTADAEFHLVDAYAFPNPARGSQNITIRVQVGLADQVDVSIYDISGRLMDGGSTSTPQILDDGNGKGPQYTFDLVWNTSGAGSGIYIYSITAKKAGASPIHKRGKAGVIK